MKTTCLIIDDEPLAIEVIKSHLENLPTVELIGTYASAVEAFEKLRSTRVDLIFLDIEMPQLSGLDLLRVLDHPPKVILVTAHREYAVESFDLDVVDYLIKPVSFQRFLRAIGRYTAQVVASRESVGVPPAEAFITVRTDRRNARICLSDVIYIESLGDYVKIHTEERTIVTRESISHLEDALADAAFLRIHRSFLIPVARITSFSAEKVHLGDATLPIGRTYRRAVVDRLGTR